MWPFRGKRWEWQFFLLNVSRDPFSQEKQENQCHFFFLSRTSWDNFIYLTCHKRCVAIRNQEVLQCICYCFVCLFFLIKMRFTINAYENSTQCDRFLFAIWPRDLFAGKDGSGSFLLNVSRDPFSQGNKTQRRFFFLAVIVGQFDKFDLSTKCDLWKSRSATFFLLHCMFFFSFFLSWKWVLKKCLWKFNTMWSLFNRNFTMWPFRG